MFSALLGRHRFSRLLTLPRGREYHNFVMESSNSELEGSGFRAFYKKEIPFRKSWLLERQRRQSHMRMSHSNRPIVIGVFATIQAQDIPPALFIAVLIILVILVLGIVHFKVKTRGKRAAHLLQPKAQQAADQRAREIQEIEQSSDLTFLAKASRSNDPGVFTPARLRLEKLILQTDPKLENIKDDGVLAVIIEELGSSLPQLRRAAIAQIGDQRALAKIVTKMNSGEKGRLKAVKRISDPDIAAALLNDRLSRLPHFDPPSAEDVNLLVALIKNLSESHLVNLMERSMDRRGINPPIPPACIIAAVEQISDPQLLVRVCEEFAPRFSAGETRSAICEAALTRITDQKLLLETAAKIDGHGLGTHHLELIRNRITDESLRAELEHHTKHQNGQASGWRETR